MKRKFIANIAPSADAAIATPQQHAWQGALRVGAVMASVELLSLEESSINKGGPNSPAHWHCTLGTLPLVRTGCAARTFCALFLILPVSNCVVITPAATNCDRERQQAYRGYSLVHTASFAVRANTLR
jgi:hypothetical protein